MYMCLFILKVLEAEIGKNVVMQAKLNEHQMVST